MKSGTGIKITHKTTTITSTYNVTMDYCNLTTTVTNDPTVVMCQLSRIKESKREDEIIGLEVQFCRYSSKPAILTLCGFSAYLSLIIQFPCLDKISGQLRNLFSDKRCKFVGANVGHSVALLKEEYGIDVARYEDISDIASGRPVEEFLHLQVVKRVSKLMMDLMIMRKTVEVEGAVWENEKLDEDLVAYATLESYLSYMIGVFRK